MPHVHITAALRNNLTYLKNSYAAQPFKVANVTEDKLENLLRLMLMSSSPGVLNKDDFKMDVNVEAGAALHCTTQGYQRIYTMQGRADLQMNVHMADNASMFYLPHPTVPHSGSDFSSVSNIHLQKRHQLIWSEIITCGRKLSGEEFLFRKFQSVVNIYVEGKLAVRENVLLEPFKRNIHAMGQLEGYTHQSSLMYLNTVADMDLLSALCLESLSGKEHIHYGVSALPVNGLLVRILGYKGEQLFDCNNQLASILQRKQKEALALL